MEFLKTTAVALLLCMATFVHAQTQQQMQDAFSKSYSLEAERKYNEAISQFTSVFSASSYEINLRLGWLTYLNGDNDKSISYYKICITLMPVATEPLWGIIKPYAVKKDWVSVENSYKSILRLDPKNSTAHYWLGVTYYNRKDYTTAKKYFDVSLNLNPFDYNVLLMSAWTNYFLGNTSEAKTLFNKSLLNHPNDASALEGLALIK
jgi:tetratricopeptide (TPR) repeat protein